VERNIKKQSQNGMNNLIYIFIDITDWRGEGRFYSAIITASADM
jgi:hypothetical protein